MKILFSILFLFAVASCSAQGFFKPLPKLQHASITRPGVRGATIVTTTDSSYTAFRPIVFVGAYSIPNNMIMSGTGISWQHLDYNFATQRTTCTWSISGVMWAGGIIAPTQPYQAISYGIMLGFLNNTVNFGPAINSGKLQGVLSVAINFNN